MRKKERVERTTGDDILDEISLHINKKLKTEKAIDNQKNNVYFWLFKFLVLILYLIVINVVLYEIKELGVDLINLIFLSLSSVFAGVYSFIMWFITYILNVYILYKNLVLFKDSPYYKRLYKNDVHMYANKVELFDLMETILKALSIAALVIIGFISLIVLSLIVMLIVLMASKIYQFPILITLCFIFALCSFIFAEIEKKFFNVKTIVNKKYIYAAIIGVLVSTIFFQIDVFYDNSPYNVSKSLPQPFEVENKRVHFDITNKETIYLKTDAKFNNFEIIVDNNLDDEIVLDFEYYKTAKVSYTNHFSENDDLIISFDSDIKFSNDDFIDLLTLGVESIEKKTIYNYNMLRYPRIKVYVNSENKNKVKTLNYYQNLRRIK